VLNLTRNLTELGNSITLIAPKRGRDITSQYDGQFKQVHRLRSFFLPGWPYPTLRSVSIPKYFGSEIKSIIRNGDFDLIHVHDPHYPFSWFGVKSAKKYGIPSVLTLHGMYSLNPNVLGGKTMIEQLFNKYFLKRTFSNINAVIGLTEQITNYARIFCNQSGRYFTIPNGVDVELYKENMKLKNKYRQEHNINTNSLVILFLGRIEEVKGIIEFVNAAKNLVRNKKIEVLIVGEGSLDNRVKLILKGIERIHLLPWQPVQDIHKFYIASDIFVLPSKFEGVPLTIIEAMNAGLYIVYTPVGGIPEFIEDYPRKTLLNTGSSKEIINVLTEIISHYSDTNGKDAALNYARKFDWKNLAQDTIKVYEKCFIGKK